MACCSKPMNTIPAILIKEVMQKLHQGHLDIENNWQERLCVLARPKTVTKQTWCTTCRSQSRQQKKPMIPVLAQQPRKRVSVDFLFFFLKGRNICVGQWSQITDLSLPVFAQFAMQYDFNYVTLPQSQKKGVQIIKTSSKRHLPTVVTFTWHYWYTEQTHLKVETHQQKSSRAANCKHKCVRERERWSDGKKHIFKPLRSHGW